MRPAMQWTLRMGASIVFFVSLGCGGPRVYPVQGKVTFAGKPLAGGGVIVFVPLDGQAQLGAGGEIATDGTYRLTTHKPGDGSAAGKFRVLIVQSADKEPEAAADGQKATRAISTVAPADRIPPIYADPQQSPLTATVESKKGNEINFDLQRLSVEPPSSRRG